MRSPLGLLLIASSSIFIKALPLSNPRSTLQVWSDWSAWTNCSRSCGSGVSYQQRSCLSNCTTDSIEKRYQSCCVQDCPENSLSLREEQCLTYAQTRTDGNWTLAKEGNDDCILNCEDRQSDSTQVRLLQTYVTPGTPCKTNKGEKGVCLGNQCFVVGCDSILGSTKKEDKCLQCLSISNPHHNLCESRKGLFNRTSHSSNGVISILNLPTSSTSINISHPLKCKEGRLAFRSRLPGGAYLFQKGFNGSQFIAGGTTFLYHVLQSGDSYREEFTARGPLTQSLQVELHGVAMGTTPQVLYSYHLLQSGGSHSQPTTEMNHTVHSDPTETPVKYSWRFMPFSKCSVDCGHGFQTSVAKCTDEKHPERELVDRLCTHHGLEKPLPIVKPCQIKECQPIWVSGDWLACSRECGGGQQRRLVECRQFVEEGRQMRVLANLSLCDQESRPADIRQCNMQDCFAIWIQGEWSECSEEMGIGIQCRAVKCQQVASGLEVDSAHCFQDSKPATVKTCRLANCKDGKCCRWRPRHWKRCRNNCGYGKQLRNVFCSFVHNNKTTNESCCEGLEKPPTEQACWDTRSPSCNPVWDMGHYGECSGDCCGEQRQGRRVECRAINGGGFLVHLPDKACSAPKPNTSRTCRRTDCPSWSTSEWGTCTRECQQSREVQCAYNGIVMDSEQCCNQQPLEQRHCPFPCASETTPPPTTPPVTDFNEEYCSSYLTPEDYPCDNFFGMLCARTCAKLAPSST